MPDAEVLMPMNHLDASMKTGRVAFAWSSLSQWITPTPPSVSHETGEMLVELPLSVVAPLYMARRRPGTAQKKVVVPESIPGVFSGTATSEAPAEAAPAPPPAPTSKLGNLLGQPTKLDWPPQDVTKHVCMIDGVAGTLIASADGLPVSGQMPSHINCDTLAPGEAVRDAKVLRRKPLGSGKTKRETQGDRHALDAQNCKHRPPDAALRLGSQRLGFG